VPAVTAPRDRGELALVLHTHMPYVEGFGTWPFGEEWLWEAMATSYLPLLAVLDRHAPGGATGSPLTLSLTPVLCDQLAAPGVGERFATFLRDIRAETHRRDLAGCRVSGATDLLGPLEHSRAAYERAQAQFAAIDGDLLGRLGRHAAWTSSATHAILPLLATDGGLRLQLQTGIASHRERFGVWAGGLWLPECAYAPWLDPRLAEAGVHAACVDFTDVLGRDSADHLQPLSTRSGTVLVPIDRATHEIAWSDHGYPLAAEYRDHHRLTLHDHRAWCNGGTPYDPAAALHRARIDAADFVTRVLARLDRARADLGAPGLCVCAMDTEFLGHWWHEGATWLDAVLDEAARQGLALTGLDDALGRHEPVPAPEGLGPTSWGAPRDLSTWDGPRVADLAWRMRAAELRVLGAGGAVGVSAARALLALQASDWAFLETRDMAGPYARQRAAGHAADLDGALRTLDFDASRLRNLAPGATPAPLLQP
jgi:1,4-alpha-glucan branching enzyme